MSACFDSTFWFTLTSCSPATQACWCVARCVPYLPTSRSDQHPNDMKPWVTYQFLWYNLCRNAYVICWFWLLHLQLLAILIKFYGNTVIIGLLRSSPSTVAGEFSGPLHPQLWKTNFQIHYPMLPQGLCILVNLLTVYVNTVFTCRMVNPPFVLRFSNLALKTTGVFH